MRTEIKTVSKSTVRSYERKADGCWKQFPIGAQCYHIVTGEIYTVTGWDVMTGTGWVKYSLRSCSGLTFGLRFMLRRIKLPKYMHP